MRIVATILFGMAIGVCGCANLKKTSQTYETVALDPHRDSVEAGKKSKKAIEKIRAAKWDEAELLLQEALIADVTYGPAHNNLGWVYYQQGQYYLSAWEFEYAIKLMPNSAEPHNNLGLVLEAVGRHHEAIESYDLARSFDPENPEYLANLTRSKIRLGEKSIETASLLREVMLRDQRPEWREWASEQFNVSHKGILPVGYVSEEPMDLLAPDNNLPIPAVPDVPAGKIELPVLDLVPPPFPNRTE